MPQLTWLITGCSSGLGEQLVVEALSRGDRVIATARGNVSRLKHFEDAGAAVFELDVTWPTAEIKRMVAEWIKTFGRIDVLVNNAGYIEAGMVEEVSHEQYLVQFSTNVFGVINMTQAVLQHFRENKSGFVVFIGSVGGWAGDPGAGLYCGSKFALEGIYECLKLEIATFGIKSVIFELGFFRTKIMHPGNIRCQPSYIEDYAPIAHAVNQFVIEKDNNQAGDPKKAVSIIVDVVRDEGVAQGKEMPARLPLGPDVLDVVRKKCTDTLKICDDWERVSSSTNFDA